MLLAPRPTLLLVPLHRLIHRRPAHEHEQHDLPIWLPGVAIATPRWTCGVWSTATSTRCVCESASAVARKLFRRRKKTCDCFCSGGS